MSQAKTDKIKPVMSFPELEYTVAKAAYEKAVRSFSNADKRLSTTATAFTDAKVARNAALPDGWYAEADAVIEKDFPIYLKRDGVWLWNGDDSGFVEPSFLGEDDGFDIDVIPLPEVKW